MQEKKKITAYLAIAILLPISLSVFASINTIGEEEAEVVEPDLIEASIVAGIDYLIGNQDETYGYWSSVGHDRVSITSFVLIKLQDRAYELGKDPFEDNPESEDYYQYATNVKEGWKSVLDNCDVTHIPADKDSNGNTWGYYFHYNYPSRSVYPSGITLMALASTRAFDEVNEGGHDYDGDGFADTYGQIAQDVVDWLAWAQRPLGSWGYNEAGGSDNSNTGYAVLGLAAAEAFGATDPVYLDPVKTKLNTWIEWIQNDPGPDDDGGYEEYPDGGSGYNNPQHWVNLLKTGNLIFEMTLTSTDTAAAVFQDAMSYIERHWHDENYDPGWGYKQDSPAHYQAMYCLMKGLEYSGIELLDLDNDNEPEYDWFQEFALLLLDQQDEESGSWPSSPCYVWYYPRDPQWGTMSGEVLSTVWALLILEKVVPKKMIPVFVDIKPGSWPNPINPKDKGVTSIAICGTEDFDVSKIDPATIRLCFEGIEDEVEPLRWSIEDAATPFADQMDEPDIYAGHEEEADGFMDLVLKFKTQEIVTTFDLTSHYSSIVPIQLTLIIKGNLKEEEGGTAIQGFDWIWVLDKEKKDNV
jgi:hypothetical protein